MHGAFLCCYYRFSIGNLVPLFLAFLHLIIKIIMIVIIIIKIIITRTRRRIERTIVLPISGDLPQPSGMDLGSFCSGGGGGVMGQFMQQDEANNFHPSTSLIIGFYFVDPSLMMREVRVEFYL